MALTATEKGAVSTPAQWLHGLWEYYRRYTHSAIHTAAAAALTAFGLLVFIDPLFVMLAIGSYVGPPIVLYTIDADVGAVSERSGANTLQSDSTTRANSDFDADADSDDGDSDSDSDDGDTDSDGADDDGADADG